MGWQKEIPTKLNVGLIRQQPFEQKIKQFDTTYLKTVLVLLVIFGIVTSCKNDLKEVESLTSTEGLPVRKAKNVEFIYSERANVQVKITAPIMEEHEGKNNYFIMPQGIEILFYDTLMNVSSKLTSNYAIHKVKEQKMEAKSQVVVINEKGEKLETEHLVWEEKTGKIYSQEFVKITTEDEIIMGEGFEANQDFTKYKIHKIKGIINLEDKKK